MIELGLWGEGVPELLAEYRVPKAPMLARSPMSLATISD